MLAGGDLVGAAPLVSSLFRHESTVEILNGLGLPGRRWATTSSTRASPSIQRLMKGGCAPNSSRQYRRAACAFAIAALASSTSRERRRRAGNTRHRPLRDQAIRRHSGRLHRRGDQDHAADGDCPRVSRASSSMTRPGVNRAADELRAQGVTRDGRGVPRRHRARHRGQARRHGTTSLVPRRTGRCSTSPAASRPRSGGLLGPTHQGYRCEIEGRLLIQGTSYGRGVSVVDVELDARTRRDAAAVRSINLPVMNDAHRRRAARALAAAMPEPFARCCASSARHRDRRRRSRIYAGLAKPKAEKPVWRRSAAPSSATADSRDRSTAAGRLVADAQLARHARPRRADRIHEPRGIRANLDCRAPPCP